jgi:hypothetical protein
MPHARYLPKAPPPSLVEKLQAWSLVLPRTAAFTHLTAAELHGWWLPETPPHPVFAALRRKADPRPRRSGLYVCRQPKPFPMTIRSEGIKITTPAETLLACARDLGILDVVILANSALHEGDVTLTELKITATQRRKALRCSVRVIPLLDQRSESAWKSVMRVLHMAAEIPVEPQHEIFDDYGRF